MVGGVDSSQSEELVGVDCKQVDQLVSMQDASVKACPIMLGDGSNNQHSLFLHVPKFPVYPVDIGGTGVHVSVGGASGRQSIDEDKVKKDKGSKQDLKTKVVLVLLLFLSIYVSAGFWCASVQRRCV